MRPSHLAASVVALSLVAAGSASAQSAPRYLVTDLGDLGGGEASATAINSAGQVVGNSYLAGHTPGNTCDEKRAFLWDMGVMRELPSLPGTRFGYATAINGHGDVSGTNDVYSPNPACSGGCFPGYCESQTPVLVRDGVAIDLSAPWPWYAGTANDVNDADQVVGWSRKADLPNPRTWHAYLWQDGVRTDLGTLDRDWSSASAIGEDGVVVGYSRLVQGSGIAYGFRWSDGVMTRLPALGTNTYSGANDINSAGVIVGWSGPSSAVATPVIYAPSGEVIDLGTLGGTQGSAYNINERGDIVGYSYTSGNQSRHAFVYRDGRLWDLNALVRPELGLELIAGMGINDSGRIAGYGCVHSRVLPPGGCVDANGERAFTHAFLLTPVPSLADLENLIRSFGLPKGLETSLLAKLATARRATERGDTAVACNLLAALAHEVEAQRGKGLTESQAALILEMLSLVQADLGCA